MKREKLHNELDMLKTLKAMYMKTLTKHWNVIKHHKNN